MLQVDDGRTAIRREKAESLLEQFAEITEYRHGAANPHRQWLDTVSSLRVEDVLAFMNAWYPVSRHQPQILLFCASLFTEQRHRRLVVWENATEEDGHRPGHDPHYDLLGKGLMPKLGGSLAPHGRTERMVVALQSWMRDSLRTPAQAAGALAGIEFPALDISGYFHDVTRLCGREDLLTTDPYISIHVVVEPEHIIATHGMAAHFMRRGKKDRAEVVASFQRVMRFWQDFWPLPFACLERGAARDVSQE